MPLSRKHFRRSRDAPIVVRHAAGPQAGKTIHAALCQRTKPPAELLSKLLSIFRVADGFRQPLLDGQATLTMQFRRRSRQSGGRD